MYGRRVLCNVDGRLWFYGKRPGPHLPGLGFIDPPTPGIDMLVLLMSLATLWLWILQPTPTANGGLNAD